MTKFIRPCALFLSPLLLVGCATSSITNLTPSQQTRSATAQYPVEAVWSSRQQSIVKDSIKPFVVVGLQSFPMQPTPLLKNRWEAQIPVPAGKDHIFYQFKFDYEYKGDARASVGQPALAGVPPRHRELTAASAAVAVAVAARLESGGVERLEVATLDMTRIEVRCPLRLCLRRQQRNAVALDACLGQ